jgi:hypothetical protein
VVITVTVQTIVSNQAVQLLYGHNQCQLVQTRWSYRTDDQHAITVHFRVPDGWVRWRFARDLLVDGMLAHDLLVNGLLVDDLLVAAGLADVRIRPAQDDTLLLELCSPNGVAVFALDARAARKFLDATYDLVPLDEETEDLSVLEQLLEPARPGSDSGPPAP